MSRHLERLLKLDGVLRQIGRKTTKDLAETLVVSEHTIRSDIAFLRDRFQASLEWSQQKGFFYTDADWRLPTIPLTQGEVFALTLGARMLESYAGSAYAPQLRSALARLSGRIPEQTWLDLQSLLQNRIFFRVGAETALDSEIWQGLEQACQESREVQIRYRTASRGDEISEWVVDPYLLHIYRGTNPYVIGYCHRRQGVRWFRVDRILALQLLSDKFVVDPTFDAWDYLEMIFQDEAGGIPQTVVIDFDSVTAPYIRERRWHPTQEIREHADGSLTLQMTVRGMNDVKRWVLGYGKGAVAKDPPELVQMVEAEIKNMVLNYSGISQ
ncbi:MAG: WYL domain-containing protein [Cyanobacteriota bacterium]|nr:WYL domain-containing protein [Cyanobacteriota bacterium]